MSSQLSLFLEILSLAAFVIPLCGLLWTSTRADTSAQSIKRFLIAALSVVAIVFILPPHEDVLTGLDNSAYRLMAETLSEGRPIVGQDTSAEIVPENLRLNLRYRPQSRLRATRDIVFQTGQKPGNTFTRPFFMPLLSMAASRSGLVNRFPILLGAFWFVFVFLAIKERQKPIAAIAVTGALLISTPFPLWFSRGYFADAAGAFIACTPLLTSRNRSTANSIFSGLLIGLSVSIHPISILIAAPVFIFLIATDCKIKHAAATLLSGIAGILPLIFITRFICHPYGDWTRLSNIKAILLASSEHSALAVGAGILVLLAVAIFIASYNQKIRKALSSYSEKIHPVFLLLASVLPPAILCFVPAALGKPIRKGMLDFFNALGPSGLVSISAILLFTFFKCGKTSLRYLVTLFCWTAIPFILIKGVEVPAGIWSYRRLAPPIIAFISVGALAIPELTRFKELNFKYSKIVKPVFPVIILLILAVNVIVSPQAYFGINDAGAYKFRDQLQTDMSDADIVFFDYHRHSTPYACKLKKPVFGLGQFATGNWPAIEKWLADSASTGNVVIASSYTPCQLEDGVVLKPHNGKTSCTVSLTYPKSKMFLPAVKAEKTISISLLDVIPISDSTVTNLVQHKIMDGGPIGIRGNWFQRSGKDGMWSRENSGIIGPVHPGKITMVIEAQWFPPSDEWEKQVLVITPPWKEPQERIELQAERKISTVTFDCPAQNTTTGIYTITAEEPYSPAKFGQNGYPDDLGALIYSIVIE